MFRVFFVFVLDVLKFGLPILAWLFVIDPGWRALGEMVRLEPGAAASSPALLCLACAGLVRYDRTFRVVATAAAAWAVWIAGAALAPIAAWSAATISQYGAAAWAARIWPSIVAGHLISLLAGLALVAFAAPGVAESLRAILNGRRLKNEESTSGLHGSARFATETELRCLSGPLTIGQFTQDAKSQVIRWPLEAHLCTLAPTRAGKGASLIIPACLDFRGPIVVIDPKAESLMVAGRRRRRKIAAIDPYGICAGLAQENPKVFTPEVASWNPLDFINDGTADADIDTLIDALFPPVKEGGEDEHFHVTATRLMRGLIAYTLTLEPDKRNLLTVRDFLLLDEVAREDLWDKMEATGGSAMSAASLCRSVGDRELGSILSSTQNILQWLDNQQLAAAVKTSTFKMHDLIDAQADLFICIPPHRLKQAKSLLRIFTGLSIASALRDNPRERILFIVDEAPLIGRLDSIESAYRVGAGRNISVWIFAQTLGDLEATYGKDIARSLLGNSEAVFTFGLGQTNFETCEWISKALGDKTVITETVSMNSGKSTKLTNVFASTNSSEGRSRQEVKRALMLPGDIAQMDSREVIVLTSQKKQKSVPLKIWQARYFERPEFAGRFDSNPYI